MDMLCRDCRYWQSGQCRRRSPVLAGFPVTLATDWCGEWVGLDGRIVADIPGDDDAEKA